jgi:hypothetical protein
MLVEPTTSQGRPGRCRNVCVNSKDLLRGSHCSCFGFLLPGQRLKAEAWMHPCHRPACAAAGAERTDQREQELPSSKQAHGKRGWANCYLARIDLP